MTMREELLVVKKGVAVSGNETQTQTVYASYTGIVSSPSDETTFDRMTIVEASGSLEFWNDPGEDIYTENDGDAT